MNIKKAVDHYNKNKSEEEPKMNLEILGGIVFPDNPASTGKHTINSWNTGKRYSKLRASHVKKMAETLNVDADYLMEGIDFGETSMDQLSINGLLALMVYTGQTANGILRIKPMENE